MFDEKCRIFHLVASSSCQGHCLLKVRHFFHQSKTDGVERKFAYVLSAGTDGRISLWDVSEVVLAFCKNLFAVDKARNSSDIVTSGSNGSGDVGTASRSGNVRGSVISDIDSLGCKMPATDRSATTDNPEHLSSLAFDKMSSADKISSADSKGLSAEASRTSNGPTKLVKRDSIDSISGNLSGENSSSEASYSLSSEEEEEELEEEDGGKEDDWNWNSSVGDLGKPVAVLEVHQSGINALDVKQINGKEVVEYFTTVAVPEHKRYDSVK